VHVAREKEKDFEDSLGYGSDCAKTKVPRGYVPRSLSRITVREKNEKAIWFVRGRVLATKVNTGVWQLATLSGKFTSS